MIRMLVPLPLLLLAAAAETPFEPSVGTFADATACAAHLAGLAGRARAGGYDAVEGPYQLGPGDVRIHMVRAEGAGHVISEYRCLAEKMSERRWTHSMAGADAEFTVESAARAAPWLKKPRAEQ